MSWFSRSEVQEVTAEREQLIDNDLPIEQQEQYYRQKKSEAEANVSQLTTKLKYATEQDYARIKSNLDYWQSQQAQYRQLWQSIFEELQEIQRRENRNGAVLALKGELGKLDVDIPMIKRAISLHREDISRLNNKIAEKKLSFDLMLNRRSQIMTMLEEMKCPQN